MWTQAMTQAWTGLAAQQWDGALLWLGADAPQDVHAMAARAGGHALLVQSPASHRATDGCFQPLDAGNIALHRLLKNAFDPDRRFNPERLYRGL